MTEPNKVFIVCPGLGRINRGYESFARQLFDNLKLTKEYELFLIKGAGLNKSDEFVAWSIARNSFWARRIGNIINKDGYWIEQFTFCISIIKKIIVYKPDLIYYSDFILGTFLWHLRRVFRFKYILLFSNGAPNKPPFTRMDHVQQLLPKHFDEAIEYGYSRENMTLLQYGFEIRNTFHDSTKNSILQKLNLPNDKKIILSVGALNSAHKRMDYVINEFVNLANRSSYYLVLLGQFSEQTESLIAMCNTKLDINEFTIKQTDLETTYNYMACANYFILASFLEGLPRVLPEALFFGLRPIVHDYVITRETLSNYGIFRDLSKVNQLQSAIDESDQSLLQKQKIIQYAELKYSWNQLLKEYVALINYCLLKYA